MRKYLFLLLVMLLSLAASAQIVEEGETVNGLKEGNWYEIDAGKNLIRKMIQYHEGKKNGVYIEIDETGALVKKSEFVDDQLNGSTMTWFRGGRLSGKNTYKNGVLDGEQIECYEQGATREIAFYKDGLRDGLTTWFDQSGNRVMSIEYKAGKFEGKQETFYKGGMLKSSKTYKDNIQDGPAVEYYESGAIKSECNYKNGKVSGKVKQYEDKKIEVDPKIPGKEEKESKVMDVKVIKK